MGWIISTCILGGLLLFVLFLGDYVAIANLREEIDRLSNMNAPQPIMESQIIQRIA